MAMIIELLASCFYSFLFIFIFLYGSIIKGLEVVSLEKLVSTTTQEGSQHQFQNLTFSAYLFVWYNLLPLRRYIIYFFVFL